MNKPLPKAVLFDLDDTIIAFSDAGDSAWTAICEQYASDLNVTAAGLLNSINDCRDWFWQDPERHKWGRHNLLGARRKIVGDAIRTLNINPDEIHIEIADAYSEMRLKLLRPFPGAIETLDHLRNEGVRLALLTNGDAEGQRRKVVRFGLESRFDCILIEGEFGVGKPEDQIYLYALSALKVSAKEAWMVGDNLEWEVAVPQRLGLVAIWVDFAGSGLPDTTDVKPDYIIQSISELAANF